MDAILQGPVSREAELTALARLVMYAQAAARDLGAREVDHHLAKSLDAIVRELENPSDDAEMQAITSTAPFLATCQ
jgi:hypothetical protein